MKISVVINTYNAEAHLRKVLESVKDFDEILICDMHSTDKTLEIAEEYGATIVYHENTGFVEPAKMFAIQSARYEWVLTIDADEIVTPQLKDFLYDQLRRKDCPEGIWIPRKNYFMGRFMRCTYPNYLLRFFRKEKIYWPPLIHTHPRIEGRTETIPARKKELAFIHLADDSVYMNVAKTNQYTDHEKERRKNRSYGYFSLFTHTFFRFFKYYILKGGIMDGKAGLAYCGLSAFYKWVTITKLWENEYHYDDVEKDLEKMKEYVER